MWRRLGRYFFNGLMAILPLYITIWLLVSIFKFLDGILGRYIASIIGYKIPGLGILVSLIFILVFGYLATALFTRRILRFVEKLLYKLPIINTVYSSVKQINRIIFLQKETKAFKRVCAVEYPRKGIYSIGFVTGKGIPQIRGKRRKEYLNVFIPTSPTPATGFMIVVPAKDVIMLDIKIDDALKLIISGGVLTPTSKIPKLTRTHLIKEV